MPRRFPWASLPDEELLEFRLKDLKVGIEGTWLERCLASLHDELDERGIRVRPHAWVSDEWFSPDTTPGIAVPFYLTHPRLMRLERRKVSTVEGATQRECMRILRHEAGHVVQHSYRLQRRRRWQELFGRSSTHYPTNYRPNPASKQHVQHLRHWYAQAHPDEDFAETFAVWLTPGLNWRRRYVGWPAIKKLQYVDELMGELASERPLLTRRLQVDPLNRLDQTLAEYYRRKRAFYVVGTQRTYDRDLRRIFSGDSKHRRSPAASAFLREHRLPIRQMVAKWTGEYPLALDAVVDEMIKRSSELKLRAHGSERQLLMDCTAFLTARTVHSLCSQTRHHSYAL
jgi:hypothetical protein